MTVSNYYIPFKVWFDYTGVCYIHSNRPLCDQIS